MKEPEKNNWIRRIKSTIFNPNTRINDRYRMDLISVLNPDLEYYPSESTDYDDLLGPSGLFSVENRGRRLKSTDVVNYNECISTIQSFDDIKSRMEEMGDSPTMFEISAYNSSVESFLAVHPEEIRTNLDFITSLSISYINPYLKHLETDIENTDAFVDIVDNALKDCSYDETSLPTLIYSINRWSENNTDSSNHIKMILKECIHKNIESFTKGYSRESTDPIIDLFGNGFILMMESLVCGHFDESVKKEISSFVTSSIDYILGEGNPESVEMIKLLALFYQ